MTLAIAQLWWARLTIALVCLVAASAASTAQPAQVQIGDMVVDYDTTRWRIIRTGEHDATAEPVGTIARDFDPVRIVRVPDGGRLPCTEHAGIYLSSEMYEDPVVTVATTSSGLAMTRLMAWTRCRNAMPKGHVACLVHNSDTYLVLATHPGCRSPAKALFRQHDPLGEILDGLSFAKR